MKQESSSEQKDSETYPVLVCQLYLKASNELPGKLKNKMGFQDCNLQKDRGGLDKG